LALVPKPTVVSPGQRFRLEQWSPLLLEHGISVAFAPFESPRLTKILYEPGMRIKKAAYVIADAIHRRAALRQAKNYDVVVVYREASLIGPAIFERQLASSGKPLIFDFDDAIWAPGSGSVNGAFARLRFPGKTATICKLASAVVVSNAYLAHYASRFNQKVHIIPSTIDLAAFPVQPPLTYGSPFTVVWSGSVSTLPHLETAKDALERVGRKRKTLLKVICSRAPGFSIDGVEMEFIPWTTAGEAARLGASHVGIMPLPDNEFTRGKGGFKALLYMAVGRPAVASPVGVNSEIIASGQNGLLAGPADEWVQALNKLADSSELRARLAAAGRATVESRFSSHSGAAAFAEVVLNVKRDAPESGQKS